jgi:hypothetical protein
LIVHFNNAPIHGTTIVVETHKDCELIQMENPPYRPELVLVTSSSSVPSKSDSKGRLCPTRATTFVPKGLSQEIRENAFAGWMRRLRNCVDRGSEHQG